MAPLRLNRTKLQPPRMVAPSVERPRLVDRLDAHRGRVTLISASAGFGKSVLVSQWLARQRVPVAWLSLDRLDNDPSRFLAHLAAAVSELGIPGADVAGERIAGLAGPGAATAGPLFEALAGLGPEPVLVLDDLHEVESPAVMEVVETLVRAPAPAPRLALLARVDPPFATARLRVNGALLEIRERDLRFTLDEAVQLYDLLLPGLLDRSMVARLGERTEGWVTGLRLAAIALESADDPATLVASFAGTHRFVMEYLLEEALDRQTDAVRRFLMETSILRRFNADTCVAVTGDPGAAELLERAHGANLFLVPLGDGPLWYRYHHLFSELLRFRLERQDGARLEELHRRASDWFAAHGDISTALEHAAAMRDRGHFAALLDANARDMLSRSELAALRQWTAYLPEPLPPRYPALSCTLGWVRVVTERTPDLVGILRSIDAALDGAPHDYDPTLRRRATIEREVLTAFAARHHGRLEEARDLSERALTGLDEGDSFTRGLLTFNLGRVLQSLGWPRKAGEHFMRSWDDSLRSGNLYVALAGLGHGAAVAAQVEGVGRAMESLAAAVAFAGERGLTRYPAFATVEYQRGHVALLGGELEEAGQRFRSAVELGGGDRLPEGHANGLLGLARVAMLRGRLEEAEACLVEAEALGRGSNLALPDTTLALERARLAGAREAADPTNPAPDLPFALDDRWTTERETACALALGQALRRGRVQEAKELAHRLDTESEARERGPARVLALTALAQLAEGDERWRFLDQAVTLAATRGYVGPFLEGDDAVRALLRAGLTHLPGPPARAFARSVLDRAEAGSTIGSPLGGEPALTEALTEREIEVLAHLCQGRSNKAIARLLFVSVDTVKTHLKHVYAKLGVNGRTECVARAGELGLVPGREPGADRGHEGAAR